MAEISQNNSNQEHKVLIIGGAGFLGSNLVRRVLREPSVIKVTVVDSLHPIFQSSRDSLKGVEDKITFIQGDIRDQKLLRELVPLHDIIFNCAAQSSHPKSLADPVFDIEINCIGNIRLLEAIRDYNPQAVVVYPSSSTLIGKAIGDVVDESHGEKPLDIYSANKGVAEKYYRIFNRVHDLKTVVLRFANLYGPFGKNDPQFGFINYFIHLALANEPIKIFGSGEQTRNVMFVDDATDIMWNSVFHPSLIGESYFAVHHHHHTVKEIAEAIVKTFGTGRIEYIQWPDVRKRIEIEKVFISSARLHYATDWRPKHDLEQGLALTKERMQQDKK